MTTAAPRAALFLGTALLAATVGCGKADPTATADQDNITAMQTLAHGQHAGPDAVGTGAASPTDPAAGGAPTYGEATGTGFHTGDAPHSGGTGSGLMGFHGTGAYGTSAAISDTHPAGEPPKNAPQWVLPEQ